jgi:[ribosomal protein S5]-alanine N-acetyltransferase
VSPPAPSAAAIETARLRLRAFRADDAASVQRQLSDREVACATASIPHPYPEGAATAWIVAAALRESAGEARVLAITRAADAVLVGAIELRLGRGGQRAELGFWIGRAHWGRGYATEAGRAVVRWAFQVLGLHRVHAAHFTRNPASGAVLRNLGMRHEGTLRAHVVRCDVPEDVELYGVLEDDDVDSPDGPRAPLTSGASRG